MNRVTSNCKQGIFKKLQVALIFLLSVACVQTVNTNSVEAKKRRGANRLDKRMKKSQYGLFGLRLHLNSANLDVSRNSDPFVDDPESNLGFGFGVTFDKGLNNLMSLRVDALYQNKNFSAKAKNNYNLAVNQRVSTSNFLDYIEVPVMLVARFMHGQYIRPFGGVGLYGAMRLPTTESTQEEQGAVDEPGRPFGFFDYGFVMSAGSYFVLSKGAGFLSAELRYSKGLANVADTGIESTQSERSSGVQNEPLKRQTYNMSNFSVMLAYYF